ncbi:MAG: amylo-alpha-1,6-glucosidase, partial [Candidatus Omnitrophota bacterium]
GVAQLGLAGSGIDITGKFVLRDVLHNEDIEFVPDKNAYADGSIYYKLSPARAHVFEVETDDENLTPAMKLYYRLYDALDRLMYYDGNGEPGVYAGFPHFRMEWGRDTMISLLGIISAGRTDLARKILVKWARLIDTFRADGGVMPNVSAWEGGEGNWHTSDAPLWFVEAVYQYMMKSNDWRLMYAKLSEDRTLLRVLKDVMERYTIDPMSLEEDGIDAARTAAWHNGLIYSDAQASWMDTRHTPRRGYPVEIQALYYNALKRMTELEPCDVSGYSQMADRTKAAFNQRFRNPDKGCLYDVLGTGNASNPDHAVKDTSVRPNQILAAYFGLLDDNRAREVIASVRDKLLIPGALRSLAPDEPWYHPYYAFQGDDEAYHNGTGWVWLYPIYWIAAVRYGMATVDEARAAMTRDLERLTDWPDAPYNTGSLPELVDGGFPAEDGRDIRPKGANQQAWSVAMAMWGFDALAGIEKEKAATVEGPVQRRTDAGKINIKVRNYLRPLRKPFQEGDSCVTFGESESAIIDFLTRENCRNTRYLLFRLFGDNVGVDEISCIEAVKYQEGWFSQIFRAEIRLKDGRNAIVSLNVPSKYGFANGLAAADFHNMERYYQAHPYKVACPLVLGKGRATTGAEKELNIFAIEWLEGYHEMNRSNGLTGFVINTFTVSSGNEQPRIGRGMDTHHGILRQVACMLTQMARYDEDSDTGDFIDDVNIDAGDFMIKPLGAETYDLRLVTIRNVLMGRHFHEFLDLMLDGRLYQWSGFSDNMRRLEMKAVLTGILQGLVKKYGDVKGQRVFDRWMESYSSHIAARRNGFNAFIRGHEPGSAVRAYFSDTVSGERFNGPMPYDPILRRIKVYLATGRKSPEMDAVIRDRRSELFDVNIVMRGMKKDGYRALLADAYPVAVPTGLDVSRAGPDTINTTAAAGLASLVRDLDSQQEAALALRDFLTGVALKNKLVLAFDSTMGGDTLALFRELENMKRHELAGILSDVDFVFADPDVLAREVGERVDRAPEREKPLVFMFARRESEGKLRDIDRKVNTVYVKDGAIWGLGNFYYPLAEIVTITLGCHLGLIPRDNVASVIPKEVLASLNIGDVSVIENKDTLFFELILPKEGPYKEISDLINRYANLRRLVIHA